MKELKFLYLLVALFLLSCGGKGHRVGEISVDEHISMENVKPIRDIVDSIRYVSLKYDSPKRFFSSEIDKIMTKGDTMYIWDQHITKSLRAYKKDGEFLFDVGERGKGHGEYIELNCFTIDNQYFYCIDNATAKLRVYNIHNGKFVKTYDMFSRADDVAVFEDGNFMLFNEQMMLGTRRMSSNEEIEEEGFKIFITDQNLKIIDKLFPFSEDDCRVFSTVNAFTENRDKIVFSQMAKDTIVVFDKNSYLEQDYYVVDFGENKASVKDKQDIDRLIKRKHLNQDPVYIVDSLIIGDARMPELGDFWAYGIFVYDIKNKQTYQNANVNDMRKGKIPIDKFVLPFAGVVDNEIISVLTHYGWYQNLVKLGFPAAPKYLEKQLEDGEPILVFYSLKDFK